MLCAKSITGHRKRKKNYFDVNEKQFAIGLENLPSGTEEIRGAIENIKAFLLFILTFSFSRSIYNMQNV